MLTIENESYTKLRFSLFYSSWHHFCMLLITRDSVTFSIRLALIHLAAKTMRKLVSPSDAFSDLGVVFEPDSLLLFQFFFSYSSRRSSNLIKFLVDTSFNLCALILQIIVYITFPAIFGELFIFSAWTPHLIAVTVKIRKFWIFA